MIGRRATPEGNDTPPPAGPPATLCAVLEKLPSPVFLVAVDQRISFANQLAQEVLQDKLTDRALISVIRHPDMIAAVQSILEGRAAAECRFVARQGVTSTYRVSIRRLNALSDGVDGALVILNDITSLERAEQIQSEFVANVSHELRSPLTALKGFIETLQGPAAEDAAIRQQFLATMETEAARMGRLINDLLNLSKVEVNEQMRPTETARIDTILHRVGAILAPPAEGAAPPLVFEGLDPEMILPGDVDQLEQVFHNLIENALRYGGGAEVIVRASRLDKAVGIRGPALRIDVQDKGPGIDPLHIPRLTGRFYRVDDHRSRGLGGTGLGLAIVKHIVSRHRGRLLIESEKGRGSTFSVLLPTT